MKHQESTNLILKITICLILAFLFVGDYLNELNKIRILPEPEKIEPEISNFTNSYKLTLPKTNGSSGQILATTDSGELYWTNACPTNTVFILNGYATNLIIWTNSPKNIIFLRDFTNLITNYSGFHPGFSPFTNAYK